MTTTLPKSDLSLADSLDGPGKVFPRLATPAVEISKDRDGKILLNAKI